MMKPELPRGWKKLTPFGDKPLGNHMFYPDIIEGELIDSSIFLKVETKSG
ncbi:hypothetical protein [Marinilabilia rubra]|nr:hypothetical protein [Marinilabilia rubra]